MNQVKSQEVPQFLIRPQYKWRPISITDFRVRDISHCFPQKLPTLKIYINANLLGPRTH